MESQNFNKIYIRSTKVLNQKNYIEKNKYLTLHTNINFTQKLGILVFFFLFGTIAKDSRSK